jgi:hypothetical protein
MSGEFVFQLKRRTRFGVQLNLVVFGDGEGLAVGGEGMVSNGPVEKKMNLWRSHFYTDRSSLYYLA